MLIQMTLRVCQRTPVLVPDGWGRGGCIPEWYHYGMSKQIAVRLDDDLVEFVDEIVGSGGQPSRAAVSAASGPASPPPITRILKA